MSQDFASFPRFTHKASMMKGSSLHSCISFSIMAEEFITVPELLDLSRRRLRLQVIPSTVWLVLLKTLEQQPHLAHAVCDEVIIYLTTLVFENSEFFISISPGFDYSSLRVSELHAQSHCDRPDAAALSSTGQTSLLWDRFDGGNRRMEVT